MPPCTVKTDFAVELAAVPPIVDLTAELADFPLILVLLVAPLLSRFFVGLAELPLIVFKVALAVLFVLDCELIGSLPFSAAHVLGLGARWPLCARIQSDSRFDPNRSLSTSTLRHDNVAPVVELAANVNAGPLGADT